MWHFEEYTYWKGIEMLRQKEETNTTTRGDENGKLKEELQAELEKELRLPDSEFDYEKTLYMLEILRKKEAEQQGKSPDDKEPTSEEQAAAFIKRFNERNGTNFALTKKELESRKRAARTRRLRAAAILLVVIGSFAAMNEVTKASKNLSIFEFLRKKATQFVYEINAGEILVEDDYKELVDVFNIQEITWNDLFDRIEKPFYIPAYIPQDLNLTRIVYKDTNKSEEYYIRFYNDKTDDYIRIVLYQSRINEGYLDLFIGDQWYEKEVVLDSGEKIVLYIGEKEIITMLSIDYIFYVFSTNIEEHQLIEVINSMEVTYEENQQNDSTSTMHDVSE